MANLSIGDMVQVTVNGLLFNQRTMNNFYYRITALTGTVDNVVGLTALHGALNGAGKLLPSHLACCPENWARTQVWYQVVKPSRLRRVTISAVSPGEGPGSADTANVQGSITRFGDLATRKDIGGIRIPIGTTSETINSGYLVALQKTAMEVLGLEMTQVYTTITPAITFTPMVSIPKGADPWVRVNGTLVQDTVRVLRRRTVGLGI